MGRHLKGKRRCFALKLLGKLRGLARKLRVPQWVKSLGELCRWFMGLLKNLFKPKLQTKHQHFRDYNEHLWQLHEQEVERIRLKRAEYEAEGRSVGEVWRDWAARQRQEMEWQRKQADLARERLRAAVRAGDDRPAAPSSSAWLDKGLILGDVVLAPKRINTRIDEGIGQVDNNEGLQ